MIDWELRPLQGFGPLDFGMAPAEVNQRLGPPRFEKHHSPTDYRQSRGKGTKGYDVILGFDPHALTDGTFPGYPNDISFSGVKLLQVDPDVSLAALQGANGGTYAVYFGSLFGFDKLGIVLSDWRDLDSSDRWIAAGSRKGYEIMVGTDEPDEIVK